MFGFLISYFVGWFDLVVDIIKDLIYVGKLLSSASDAVFPLIVSFFPDYVLSMLAVFIAVAVIYKVLGREG